jgi:RimJ/RimL family protein N-acetyltransferase
VERSDLDHFFEHQREPLAAEMAAFPRRERAAFLAHWDRILADPNVVARTILLETEVAGNVVCWQQAGKRLIGYWLGSQYWGRGVASHAVLAFVEIISARPLHAYVATHNLASIRVLQKAGFRLAGESRATAPTSGKAVDEFLYELSG